MQQKNHSISIGLFLILITCLPLISSAQKKEQESNSSESNLTKEDYEAILDLNKMKVYKFPVKIPEDQRCNVFLYKQEFDSSGIICDEIIWGSPSPHKKIVDRKPVLNEEGESVYTPLDGIRIITKEEGRNFALGIEFGDFGIPSMPLTIDSIYTDKHYVRSFSLPEEFPIGSEIPLVLIGSSWSATDITGKKSRSKFCLAEEILPDLSREQFKEMPHYIIFGIRIIEP